MNKIVVNFVVLIILTGCSASRLRLEISASPYLNPAFDNSSLPVLVKIYQLKDDYKFNMASFNDLWRADVGTLDDSLLSKQEITVLPNGKEKITMKIAEDASYIGLTAVFREPESNNYKSLVKINSINHVFGSSLKIVISGKKITVL